MSTLGAQASVLMRLRTLLPLALTPVTYLPVEPDRTVLHVKQQGPMTLTIDGDCLLALKSKVAKKSLAPLTNVSSATLMEGPHSSKKSIQELLLVTRKFPSGADTELLILEIKDPMEPGKSSALKSMIKLAPLWMSSKKMISAPTREIISGARFSRIKRPENMVSQNKLNQVWPAMISELFKPVI